MMKALILYILLLTIFVSAQTTETDENVREYKFLIQDSPAQLFTMRQMNQSYLSAYRLFARGLYASTNEPFANILQVLLETVYFMPLTHEEGHRSILTVNNIGSISQPYFNRQGAAYVKGVSDATLMNLRDTNLPTYIRLHTGGLESDYMLTKRMETLAAFDQDDFKNYKYEYWIRKYAILQYYVTGLFSYDVDIKEEKNELERDIVGYDTYGAARHLFRPDMDFYRYTKYKELTGAEKDFVKRLGIRSLLNLVHPLIIGIDNFKFSENVTLNAGLGYTMAPFGDFIDENLWMKYKKFNIGFYARQFQNKNNWFNGFGLSIIDLQLHKNLFTTLSGHFWSQPKNFDFNTDKSFTGGALDLDLRYFFINRSSQLLKGISIDMGMIYKTKGFLPEELYLKEHFGVRLGSTVRI